VLLLFCKFVFYPKKQEQRVKLSSLVFLFLFSCITAYGQGSLFEQKLQRSDSINLRQPREKLFVHYDRPYYTLNDTLWLKGYVLSATDNIPTDSSGLAYVEIINAENELVKRISLPCYLGCFYGNITLYKEDYKQGEYLLRAYTRFMRNFGDSLFFESRFKIADPAAEEWKVSIRQLSFAGNRLVIAAALKGQETATLGNRRVSVRLRSKNKNLFRATMLTGPLGDIYIDTVLKEASHKNLLLEIAEKETVKLQLPVTAGAGQAADLQFLPEGGTFIAGKEQRLGFKAINAAGKGVDVKGVIRDSKGNTIVSFASVHKGMGIVWLTPTASEQYTGVLDNGQAFSIPAVQSSGTSLRIDTDHADSVHVTINGTPDLYGRICYFAATVKGITLAKGRFKIDKKPNEFNLSKTVFPSGIARFTIYREDLVPVNERAVFIWQQDTVPLTITTHKPVYQKKDSVSLQIRVQQTETVNKIGSYSLAVLDTSQVKLLPDGENLLTYMLLSSDLKGVVEEPYYYFKKPEPFATDALLLTQGWVSYNWPTGPPPYPYEKEFMITGRVSNMFNKGLGNIPVTIFGKAGKSGILILDTTTNEKGTFTFRNFPLFSTDSINMVIKAVNKRGKAFNVGVELDEKEYASIPAQQMPFLDALVMDTAVKNYVAGQARINEEVKKGGIYLNEVIVSAKAKIPGSKNLNEDGGADQVVTEKMLAKNPKETLLDALQRTVKGFHKGWVPKNPNQLYLVNGNIARFVIDGTDINFFYNPSVGGTTDYIDFLDSYLKYFAAEDVKAIEVMNYPRNNSAYRSRFLSIGELMSSGPATRDFSFLEITTYTGSGPFLRKTPGMYLYRPVFPFVGKTFYSPKYLSPAESTIVPDMRTTVYWNPDVITNEKGEATISFYTSESKGSYMIILQGIDFNGRLGVVQQPLMIGP